MLNVLVGWLFVLVDLCEYSYWGTYQWVSPLVAYKPPRERLRKVTDRHQGCAKWLPARTIQNFVAMQRENKWNKILIGRVERGSACLIVDCLDATQPSGVLCEFGGEYITLHCVEWCTH
jgi:hypothetical protein